MDEKSQMATPTPSDGFDGAKWFGEGHWFVAIGYDQNGICIRDSSGWDTRHLTWSRLYGDIGFSGWVVGVAGSGARQS
jgi:hypothetical protein